MRRLDLARSCAPSPDNSLSDLSRSWWTLSNHLRFGLPLLFTRHVHHSLERLPTHSSSLYMPIRYTTSTYFFALSWIFYLCPDKWDHCQHKYDGPINNNLHFISYSIIYHRESPDMTIKFWHDHEYYDNGWDWHDDDDDDQLDWQFPRLAHTPPLA